MLLLVLLVVLLVVVVLVMGRRRRVHAVSGSHRHRHWVVVEIVGSGRRQLPAPGAHDGHRHGEGNGHSAHASGHRRRPAEASGQITGRRGRRHRRRGGRRGPAHGRREDLLILAGLPPLLLMVVVTKLLPLPVVVVVVGGADVVRVPVIVLFVVLFVAVAALVFCLVRRSCPPLLHFGRRGRSQGLLAVVVVVLMLMVGEGRDGRSPRLGAAPPLLVLRERQLVRIGRRVLLLMLLVLMLLLLLLEEVVVVVEVDGVLLRLHGGARGGGARGGGGGTPFGQVVRRVGGGGGPRVVGEFDEVVEAFGQPELLLLGQVALLEEGVALLHIPARTLPHVLDAGERPLHQLAEVGGRHHAAAVALGAGVVVVLVHAGLFHVALLPELVVFPQPGNDRRCVVELRVGGGGHGVCVKEKGKKEGWRELTNSSSLVGGSLLPLVGGLVVAVLAEVLVKVGAVVAERWC